MRVLWVSEEEVDVGGGGGNIRHHHMLLGLAQRETVDLLLVGRLADSEAEVRGALRKVIEVDRPPFLDEPTSGLRRSLYDLRIGLYSDVTYEVRQGRPVLDALTPVLRDLVASGDYDVVHLEHAVLAPLVEVVRAARPGMPCELMLHNLSSARSAQMAEVAPDRRHRFLWTADARRCRRFEARLGQQFDRVLVVSGDDAAHLPFPVTVVPNGVDLAAFPSTPLPTEPRLLFSGTFDYQPNVDGATWLVQEVLPRVRALVPEARLSLVGRRPVAEVRALAGADGVDAHFDVPAIQPFVAGARVSAVTIRVGTGTRLKALEAMAAGRPLAGTTIGLEGLGLVDGRSAVIGDDPQVLAQGIARLLTDDAFAEEVRAEASTLAQDYDWDAINERYVEGLRATFPT